MRILVVLMILCLFSCHSEDTKKVSPVDADAEYFRRMMELTEATGMCDNLIGLCNYEPYDSAMKTVMRPKEHDDISRDSMKACYIKYYKSIDDSLKSKAKTRNIGDYNIQLLKIEREKMKKIYLAEFEYLKTIGK